MLGGRYEVGRLLGAGGVASVFAARDLLLGREVAVKLFRREAQLGTDLRLQQIEARLGAAMNHYGLTTLFDAGVEADDGVDPRIYLVMEFVHGETLRERLRSGPMDVLQACWMGFDLAEALQYMHRAGFLHRDVKPANVLMAETGSARPFLTKLTDFGIAAPIGQPDLSEFTVGTAAYLSPEQVEGEDARPASDLYALGLVLLEAMTAEVAFPGGVEVSAFARLDRDPAIPAHLPPAVRDLLARMTHRAPGERVGLHQAAVELQQIVIDHLVRRRGETAPAAPDAAPDTRAGAAAPLLVPMSVDAGDATLTTLMRLTAGALRADSALLVLGTPGQAEITAWHGELDVAGVALPEAVLVRSDPAPWILEDALQDPSVQDSTLFAPSSGRRSAVVVPLLARDRRRLGWLLVLDRRPRLFSVEEIAAAADAAGLAVHELELRSAARRALFPAP